MNMRILDAMTLLDVPFTLAWSTNVGWEVGTNKSTAERRMKPHSLPTPLTRLVSQLWNLRPLSISLSLSLEDMACVSTRVHVLSKTR
jgi:hypothetical protein